MIIRPRYFPVLLAMTLLAIGAVARADDATTQPQPAVSPDAKALLSQVRLAYYKARPLQITGTINGDFDIDGQAHKEKGEFAGAIAPDGKFRDDMKDDTLLGYTGKSVYLFLSDQNKYAVTDAPSGAVNLDTIDSDVADALRQQDYSLALAFSPDAANEIVSTAVSIQKSPDTVIDSVSYPTLQVAQKDSDVTLVFDPKTYLLDRQIVDVTRRAKAAGSKEIKVATYTIDFTSTVPASLDDAQFAWAPPAGSQELQEDQSMVGKTVPAFELSDLNGKKVTSASLKGTVYVLDFWATSCAPCVASLPSMDDLNQEMHSKGVTIFAVNEQEDADTVKKFIDDKKLTLPVLLDSDGKVFDSFNGEAIPLTVIVGKDGKVRKGYLGMGYEKEIRQELEAALQEK